MQYSIWNPFNQIKTTSYLQVSYFLYCKQEKIILHICLIEGIYKHLWIIMSLIDSQTKDMEYQLKIIGFVLELKMDKFISII